MGCRSKIWADSPSNVCTKQKAFLEDVFTFLLVGVCGSSQTPAKGFNVLHLINMGVCFFFFVREFFLRIIL